MKVSAVGFTCTDVYENMNNRCYATGNGVDFLLNLRQLVPELVEGSVVSAVGNDEYGKLMKNTLKKYNVDDSHLYVDKEKATAVIKMSLNGLDRVHGERIRGVMEGYTLHPGDMEFIKTQDIIHTDLSWKVVPLLPEMTENGAKVFFDFSIRYNWPEVKEILPYITWGLFSFEEETPDIQEFLRTSFQKKNELLIATFGDKGALAYDGEKYYRQAIVPVEKLVNTVGAGDSFASGFVSGQISGKTIQESLLEGAKRSSVVLGQFNPY